MSLGVVCHWLVERSRPRSAPIMVNALDEKKLMLGVYRAGGYTRQRIVDTYVHNAESLLALLRDHVVPAGVRCYRISSSLFPLSDLVGDAIFDKHPRVCSALQKIGHLAREHGLRLTMHPGQFCVLSSSREDVVRNAVAEIERHSWVFDAMGMPESPYAAINVHGGARDSADALCRGIELLSSAARSRLTLENCESAYGIDELRPVALRMGVPITWDSHHHTFRGGSLPPGEAHMMALGTWPRHIRPLQHVANTEPELAGGSFSDRRKHSDYLHAIPEVQLAANNAGEIDLECECKMKNLAVFKAVEELGAKL